MSTKHTPWPWRVGYDGDSLPIIETASETIAYVRTNGHDAALIAAAPDLLEAIQGVVSRCGHGYVGRDGQYLKVIHAAIAKATGGSDASD